MLHDPRHDKTPSLAGFALFVASQPPEEAYDWRFCERCPGGRYLQSIDQYQSQWINRTEFQEMNALARGGDGLINSKLWTYGQLADRILAYQGEKRRKAMGPEFILILTLITPGAGMPDLVWHLPMPTREECILQANDFTVYGYTKQQKERGIKGVIGACFSNKLADDNAA